MIHKHNISPLLPLGFAVALSLLGDLSLFATLTTQLNALGLTLAQAGLPVTEYTPTGADGGGQSCTNT